ncbi:protein of unknown function [Methylocaldum szegediense]|uniref:Uncharacterized protein n=1 Tax=Methylocaldum szegediense TaxID=73780 RepID=A0ABM9I7B4_9GAMM|nr:protein of unknown function [Methylocaldum szegediense]
MIGTAKHGGCQGSNNPSCKTTEAHKHLRIEHDTPRAVTVMVSPSNVFVLLPAIAAVVNECSKTPSEYREECRMTSLIFRLSGLVTRRGFRGTGTCKIGPGQRITGSIDDGRNRFTRTEEDIQRPLRNLFHRTSARQALKSGS